ncbi:MAG: AAA family ATPase, partial [Bacteroidota bacterium]
LNNIKISKGEESNFIWCIFYSLLELVVEVLNVPEADERETDLFDELEYVFIDDPVSSLDDAHLIELAVNIAEVIKSSQSELRFIITTHNPLFYNVLYNEFNNRDRRYDYRPKHSIKRRLEKLNDGAFSLVEQSNDSPFSYHLYLLAELEKATQSGDIQKYHFNFLRNILEKTSTFLGYAKWKDLLPEETEGSREAYFNRIINLSSHSKFSGEEVAVVEDNDKRVLQYLVGAIKSTYRFK